MNSEVHNALVIGSGGREHALAWKLRQSPTVRDIFVAPGNGGTGEVGINVDIDAQDVNRLAGFASDHEVDLTVVGPETSLEAGIVDAFNEDGLPIFGPTQAASRLETDKVWASEFMDRHGIPRPSSVSFDALDKAQAYVRRLGPANIVIKASGLAAGKGVVLPETLEEADGALRAMLLEKQFGSAGERVLIQERLSGPEISILAITDGTTVVPLLPAQDHKRLADHDEGPNTGGMGAYAPVPWVDPVMIEEIHAKILQPTVHGMREEGVPYLGVLYAGLMITHEGPKVLEYNARFGDPETQPLLMLLSSDPVQMLLSSISGSLSRESVQFSGGSSVCVVVASEGYPRKSANSVQIFGLPDGSTPDVQVFHAGTLFKNNRLVTHGGRVVGVTARGIDLKAAIRSAYKTIDAMYFSGMQFRRDIGHGGFAAYD